MWSPQSKKKINHVLYILFSVRGLDDITWKKREAQWKKNKDEKWRIIRKKNTFDSVENRPSTLCRLRRQLAALWTDLSSWPSGCSCLWRENYRKGQLRINVLKKLQQTSFQIDYLIKRTSIQTTRKSSPDKWKSSEAGGQSVWLSISNTVTLTSILCTNGCVCWGKRQISEGVFRHVYTCHLCFWKIRWSVWQWGQTSKMSIHFNLPGLQQLPQMQRNSWGCVRVLLSNFSQCWVCLFELCMARGLAQPDGGWWTCPSASSSQLALTSSALLRSDRQIMSHLSALCTWIWNVFRRPPLRLHQ